MLGIIIPGTEEAAGVTDVQLPRALKFNSPDSPYLNRTPGGAPTSTRRFTFAAWVKKAKLDTTMALISGFSSLANSDSIAFSFAADRNRIEFRAKNATDANLITTAKLKDETDWFHLCIGVDTDQAVATDRVSIEINGQMQTGFDIGSYPALNYDFLYFGASGIAQEIGRLNATNYYDGYLSDVYWIDGAKLPAARFIGTNGKGRLVPVVYTGSYGNNGFHLTLSDNSAMGADTSGNGNDFTLNNFSGTVGSGFDYLLDSATDYIDSASHGDFATLDPVNSRGGTFAEGNTKLSGAASIWTPCLSTLEIPDDGNTYRFEVNVVAIGSGLTIGIVEENFPVWLGAASAYYIGYTAGSVGYRASDGKKIANNVATAYGATFTTADKIGVACNRTAGTVEFFRNGVSQGQITGLTGRKFFAVAPLNSTSIVEVNFGQNQYSNAISGNDLCKAALPDSESVTSGSFTGNASVDGPMLHLGGVPTALTINGANVVTWGVHALKTSTGAKIISALPGYNASGANTFTATIGDSRNVARAQIS